MRRYILTAWLALSTTLVFGCVIAPGPIPPICERFWDNDAVALADVVSIQKIDYKRLVTLRMNEVFRGDPPTEVTFEDPETDCGVNFHSLGRELVWLYKESGKWKAFSDWSGDRAADLVFARSMRAPSAMARVFGTVGHANPKMIVMGGPPSMTEPIQGAVVVAQSSGGHYETKVDPQGAFELSSLPPGQYTITIEGLPPTLDDEPVSVVLNGGQCKEFHFRPDTSGEISGRIVPSGKMPSPAWVTLFSASDAPKRADTGEYVHEVAQLFANEETGEFVFRHVPPGRYILAFQPGDPPDMDVPYQPRFYPDTNDRESAEVIEITEGQKVNNLDFKIGDEVATRKVYVRAIWQDGTAAQNVHLQLRNRKNSSNLTHQAVYTDQGGAGVLEAFLGISYQLESYATCKEMWPKPANFPFPVRPSHQTRQIKDVIVPSPPADAHVTVVVPGPVCSLIPKFGVIEDE